MTQSKETPKKTSFCRGAFWSGFARLGWAVQISLGMILESICFMPISLACLRSGCTTAITNFAGEIIEFAKRAKDAGVDVGLHSVSEGQHNFMLGAGRVPEVDEAIERMGQWLRSRLSSVKGRAA